MNRQAAHRFRTVRRCYRSKRPHRFVKDQADFSTRFSPLVDQPRMVTSCAQSDNATG